MSTLAATAVRRRTVAGRHCLARPNPRQQRTAPPPGCGVAPVRRTVELAAAVAGDVGDHPVCQVLHVWVEVQRGRHLAHHGQHAAVQAGGGAGQNQGTRLACRQAQKGCARPPARLPASQSAAHAPGGVQREEGAGQLQQQPVQLQARNMRNQSSMCHRYPLAAHQRGPTRANEPAYTPCSTHDGCQTAASCACSWQDCRSESLAPAGRPPHLQPWKRGIHARQVRLCRLLHVRHQLVQVQACQVDAVDAHHSTGVDARQGRQLEGARGEHEVGEGKQGVRLQGWGWEGHKGVLWKDGRAQNAREPVPASAVHWCTVPTVCRAALPITMQPQHPAPSQAQAQSRHRKPSAQHRRDRSAAAAPRAP